MQGFGAWGLELHTGGLNHQFGLRGSGGPGPLGRRKPILCGCWDLLFLIMTFWAFGGREFQDLG